MGSSVIKSSTSAQSSKGKILNELEKLVQASYTKEDVNLFIVGVDLDEPDHTGEIHKKQLQELYSRIPQRIQESSKMKIICFSPVQAIEAWLSYQHNKTIQANSLEKLSPRELKKLLYGTNRVNPRIAEKLAKDIDVEHLIKQSKSFDHFYKQLNPPKSKKPKIT
ncbi:hypothetical protein QWY31_08530 [Cytophagales bacterium LB-30]|uniref:Uncharacterized protein n=1 Tax=Shiella aurantiaca TaxID=3058365 RepID=A0ABT8F598_9BACT|nr:hypothetical protein [Shiella aurantiaca]MDN4165544.1 hypothetical protein [Shiella aurantiaca]